MKKNKKNIIYRIFSNWTFPTAIWRLNEFVVMNNINFRGKVLDLGCGNCAFVNLLLNDYKNVDIWGVDLNMSKLQSAKNNRSKLELLSQSWAHQLCFHDNSFDFILANCALEHFDNLDCVLSEIDRVLRPNGTLILSIPNDIFIYGFYGIWIEKFILKIVNKILTHTNIYGITEWDKMLDKHNIKIVNFQYIINKREFYVWLITLPVIVFYMLTNKIQFISNCLFFIAYKFFHILKLEPTLPNKLGAGMILECQKNE